MSNPMPNPFDPNSTSYVPVDVGSAAVNSCPEPLAAAAPLSVSDGVGAKPILASSPSEEAAASIRTAAASDITRIAHNPVTQAVEIRPLMLRGAKAVFEPYPIPRLALPRFAPDYEAMQAAVHDPNAPRALETDPVWADAPPKFLQRAR